MEDKFEPTEAITVIRIVSVEVQMYYVKRYEGLGDMDVGLVFGYRRKTTDNEPIVGKINLFPGKVEFHYGPILGKYQKPDHQSITLYSINSILLWIAPVWETLNGICVPLCIEDYKKANIECFCGSEVNAIIRKMENGVWRVTGICLAEGRFVTVESTETVYPDIVEEKSEGK